jgi:hypothetical protein
MNEKKLRDQYGIPAHYAYHSYVHSVHPHATPFVCIFEYCDSTITVNKDGSCTETHMSMQDVGPEFITVPWLPIE